MRDYWKNIRANIPPSRRKEAEEKALNTLKPLLEKYRHVLSYASFSTEFPTHALNRYLISQGKLLLPRVEENRLALYHVTSEDQLQLSQWGILEPSNAEPFSSIPDIALIPGLAFDRSFQRLGYGKGFYDRLLPLLKTSSYGLGFNEQLSESLLPAQPHDYPLTGLLLF